MRRKTIGVLLIAGLVVLLLGSAVAAAAEKRVIVGFKSGVASAAQDDLIEKYGGTVIDKIEELDCKVAGVSEDKLQQFIEGISTEESVEYAEEDCIAYITYTPNDPKYPQQWGPPCIKADDAWDCEKGSKGIKIAIVDTGVDYNHEDIAGNYVTGGYDWVNDDNDPMDDHGHGTHCAGIAAAVIDNNKGIAGIAQSSIMAEKVLNAEGWGYYSWVASGIIHAADNDADIISMSLGGESPSTTLERACEYAWNKGCVLVAATGNDGISSILYPAKYDTVIAVGALSDCNTRWRWSNYGPEMELIAPGVSILSTIRGNNYAKWNGTSMATPHVSGVAALVWSKTPGLTNQQVRNILKNTADDLGTPGWDKYYGYGRVDAKEYVCAALPYVAACDSSGNVRDVFDTSEDVYCKGYTGVANDWVNIYVVENGTWSWGSPIPSDVGDGMDTVQTDGSGNIPTSKIWGAPTLVGEYDVIVDVDQDGILDSSDLIDAEVKVGFEVIPEFTTIAIPVAAILGLLFFFNPRKRKKE